MAISTLTTDGMSMAASYPLAGAATAPICEALVRVGDYVTSALFSGNKTPIAGGPDGRRHLTARAKASAPDRVTLTDDLVDRRESNPLRERMKAVGSSKSGRRSLCWRRRGAGRPLMYGFLPRRRSSGGHPAVVSARWRRQPVLTDLLERADDA